MKLAKAIDLAPIRAQARAEIDRLAQMQAIAIDPIANFHRIKAAEASVFVTSQYGTTPEWLAAEAKTRGLTPAAFAALVLQKAAAADQALLALDQRRIAAKTKISATAGEQEMAAVVAAFAKGD